MFAAKGICHELGNFPSTVEDINIYWLSDSSLSTLAGQKLYLHGKYQSLLDSSGKHWKSAAVHNWAFLYLCSLWKDGKKQ